MTLQSQTWFWLLAALAFSAAGCMVPHYGHDGSFRSLDISKEEPKEPIKRKAEKEKPAEKSDEPEVSEATRRQLGPYQLDRPAPARKEAAKPALGSTKSIDKAIAQLDAIPTLSQEERDQLKADLRSAEPAELQRLIALVQLLSDKAKPAPKENAAENTAENTAAKEPAKASAPIAKVTHIEAMAPDPPPILVSSEPQPAPLPPGPAASPQALPQIIGPNSAAPPIQIVPPQSYPGAPAGGPYPPPGNPQPAIIVNPTVAPMAFPPLPVPLPQGPGAMAPGTLAPGTIPPPAANPYVPQGLNVPPAPTTINPFVPQANVPPAPFPLVAAQPLTPPSYTSAAPATLSPHDPGQVAPASANQPLAAEPPAAIHWSKSIREALKELEKELAAAKPAGDKNASADEERARKAIVARLLRLASGDRDGAVRRLDDLPQDEQYFWAHQLHALTISLDPDGPPVPSRRAALALRELRQATSRLANQATLDLRNLAFCSDVTGYGHFTRFPNADFEPEQEVLLYAEIYNLQSAETKTGFRTNFQASLQVLDTAGKVVYDHSFPPGEDQCTSRRRDFFVPFRTYIPKLSPGEYTLQLTVEDTQAKKFGQNTIAFKIKRG